ncbi:hypothetical protein PSY73_23780, partial [Shigella flexneri]|nr:hypothetical protein [Shigella flexneri]
RNTPEGKAARKQQAKHSAQRATKTETETTTGKAGTEDTDEHKNGGAARQGQRAKTEQKTQTERRRQNPERQAKTIQKG